MNFFKILFAVILAQVLLVVVFLVALGALGAVLSRDVSTDIEHGSWLVIDIYGEILEYDPPESIVGEIFGDDAETLQRILSNMEKAAVDERIRGVAIKISKNNSLGRAGVQEIREAIARVRESGKMVVAYSDGLDRKTLFLASACDSIFMPAPAEVSLTGMAVVYSFMKGTLDKLGIRPQLHAIKDYKSAAEVYKRKDMSPEAREMSSWILREFWDMETSAISADRGISIDDLTKDMEYTMFTAEEAVEAKLIDRVLYWQDVEETLSGDDDELRSVGSHEYASVRREQLGLGGKTRIAVVHVQGVLGGRDSRSDPMLGPMIGHESVVAELQRVADDDQVAAVVFRVDSPGGESLASDLIADQVSRVRARKPIVASMGDVAASGGYYISYKATKIVADPMTITGSIGSIYGKMNTSGLWNKLGITYDWVTEGPNALFWSDQTDFTPAQYDRFVDHHFRSFNMWLADVARERGMTFEDAQKLADGRVWTGRQAKGNGLIDETGGLDRAIEIAKEQAGLQSSEKVTIDHYPRRKGLLALISERQGVIAAVKAVVYRALRQDIAETLHMFDGRAMYIWTGDVR